MHYEHGSAESESRGTFEIRIQSPDILRIRRQILSGKVGWTGRWQQTPGEEHSQERCRLRHDLTFELVAFIVSYQSMRTGYKEYIQRPSSCAGISDAPTDTGR